VSDPYLFSSQAFCPEFFVGFLVSGFHPSEGIDAILPTNRHKTKKWVIRDTSRRSDWCFWEERAGVDFVGHPTTPELLRSNSIVELRSGVVLLRQ
jgi:hypothetical protein